MCGNDRSATVDCNPNLVKAIELALGDGHDLITYTDALWGKPYKDETDAPHTGDPRTFTTFEEFYTAFSAQLGYVMRRMVALYERSTAVRAQYAPTPYLSCLVGGCAEQGLDCTQGGASVRS